MKPNKILILTAAVAAIAVLVVPAVGMIVGMALASEPQDEPSTSPEEPEPPPLELPPTMDKKLPPALSPQQQSIQVSPASSRASPRQETVYTYEEEGRTVRIILQRDLVLLNNSDLMTGDTVVVPGPNRSIIKSESGRPPGGLPVFRSESGGGLMTLQGGVLLTLDPEWNKSQVDKFMTENNISAERISELGFIPNGFLVQTEPGLPSLELANHLAAQNGVRSSSPNWWNEIQVK